jgi:predicted RNase H-like nuclease
MTTIIGLDSCPYGWIASHINRSGSIEFNIIKNLSEILNLKEDISHIAIDMPVMLLNQERTVDGKARRLLGKRSSTIFNAPVEDALNAAQYHEASLINFNLTGKKISKQSFNLFNKIKQVREFKDQNPKIKIYESHPELAFMALNKKKVILASKKTAQGKKLRLFLLNEIYKQFNYKKIRNQFKKTVVNDDDILDALVVMYVGIKIYNNEAYVIVDDNNKEITISY